MNLVLLEELVRQGTGAWFPGEGEVSADSGRKNWGREIDEK